MFATCCLLTPPYAPSSSRIITQVNLSCMFLSLCDFITVMERWLKHLHPLVGTDAAFPRAGQLELRCVVLMCRWVCLSVSLPSSWFGLDQCPTASLKSPHLFACSPKNVSLVWVFGVSRVNLALGYFALQLTGLTSLVLLKVPCTWLAATANKVTVDILEHLPKIWLGCQCVNWY